MNSTLPQPDSQEQLDGLFSDFFKSQMKQPWPNAPVASSLPASPSELATSRSSESPRNAPAPARRDNTARSRFTLAASVALAVGACWSLSNGFQPGERPGPGPAVPPGRPGMLPESGASGKGFLPLETMQENKAKGNNNIGFPPPEKIQDGKAKENDDKGGMDPVKFD